MTSIPARILPLPLHAPDSPTAAEPEDPIDIFSISLSSGTLFPDYAITSHGDPGGRVEYTSPKFGEIVLDIPKHPDEADGRGLFAHYLWSAAAIAAAAIEQGSDRENVTRTDGRDWWNFNGCKVLEVGAGTALPSIIAALSSAKSIYTTDHPLSPALTTGTIVSNVKRNLFPSSEDDTHPQLKTSSQQAMPDSKTTSQLKILPHTWGQLSSTQARDLGSSFDKIIVADCMWLASQHDNLITSILHFLRPYPTGQSLVQQGKLSTIPCALIVAGFHTGRSIIASFFSKAISRGLTIEEIWEVDVGTVASTDDDFKSGNITDPNGTPSPMGDISHDGIPGFRRPWMPVREKESKEEAKKWCVVAAVTKRTAPEVVGDIEPATQDTASVEAKTDEKAVGYKAQVNVDDVGWV